MELIFGGLIVVLIAFLIFRSISLIFKVILNIVIGAIVLYIYNLIAVKFGLQIDITPLASFLTGVFGMPYVVTRIILKIFF